MESAFYVDPVLYRGRPADAAARAPRERAVYDLLDALGIAHRQAELIALLDESRHNLWMDGGKLQSHGIRFDTTAEGFRRCVADYALRG